MQHFRSSLNVDLTLKLDTLDAICQEKEKEFYVKKRNAPVPVCPFFAHRHPVTEVVTKTYGALLKVKLANVLKTIRKYLKLEQELSYIQL